MTLSIEGKGTPISNPFSTRFIRPGSIAYRFQNDGVDENADAAFDNIVQRLAEHRTGVIVGPHGSGKSTLLRSLAPSLKERFDEVGRLQLAAPTSPHPLARLEHARQTAKTVYRAQARLSDNGLLVVDGAEQLDRIAWARLLRRLRRHTQALLATSHVPLRRATVLHETRVDRDLIESLTDALLADVPQGLVEMVRRELHEQDLTKLTNVRELWFDLYDVVQSQIVPSPHRPS